MDKADLNDQPRRQKSDAQHYAKLACVLGVMAIALPLLTFVELFTLPPGSRISQFGQIIAVMAGALAGLGLVLPLALVGLFYSWSRRESLRWPIIAIVIAVLSIGLDFVLHIAITEWRGLVLVD